MLGTHVHLAQPHHETALGGDPPRRATRVLKASLAVTLALVTVEMVAGTVGNSLALISDAWHNLSDVPSLALAWLALLLERKAPDHNKTYGYHRAGVLAAFVNSLALVVVGLWILYEAVERFRKPLEVSTGLMGAVGLVALVVNGSIAWAVAGERRDVNLRVVLIHNLGDAASNVAIVVGALVMRWTGRQFIDPLLSLLISGMILWSTGGALRESFNILLEGLPKGMHLESVARAMLAVPGVKEVHDVHIWSLSSVAHALSCHVLVHDMPTSESEKILYQLSQLLAREFNITHSTIQVEHTHPPGEYHRYMPEPAETPKKA